MPSERLSDGIALLTGHSGFTLKILINKKLMHDITHQHKRK
ncbi:TPA: hypothetical protein ACRHUY_RS01265 [Neisseria meningitidis]|nr:MULTISPECIES: hypothetical protein [Neisseria]